MADDVFHTFQDYYTTDLATLTHQIGAKRAKQQLGAPAVYYTDELDRLYAERGTGREWTAGGMMLSAEALWWHNHKPYYRVYPDYAKIFSRTQLDVQVKVIEAPYSSFTVHFQRGHEPEYGDICVESMLVMYGLHRDLLKGLDYYADQPIDSDGRSLLVMNAVRELATGHRKKGTSLLYLGEDPELVLGEKLKNLATTAAIDTGLPLRHQDMVKDLFSIAVSVCFLATGGDRLVEPDVLNSDFRSYLDAVNKRDLPAARSLGAKAQRVRNGQPGFVIGREESLLGRRDEYRKDGELGGGTELHYQHQRKGHFHKFWTGPNREQLTVKWVRQTTVRPDLPLPPDVRGGSRTLDSKATEQQILNSGGSQQ
jgi:hypothetical protein